MTYSFGRYLRDIHPNTKRPYWQVWLTIGLILLLVYLIVRPPGGLALLMIGYILWVLRNYRIEWRERKHKVT